MMEENLNRIATIGYGHLRKENLNRIATIQETLTNCGYSV
jgi:hypothetical protein